MSSLESMFADLARNPGAKPTAMAAIESEASRIRYRARARVVGVAAAMVFLLGGAVAWIGSEPDAPSARVAAGGPQSARFVARAPGGYEAGGTWTLTVERAGQVLVFRAGESPGCGDTGTIQPGDRVTAEISGASSWLEAGEEVECDQR